MLRKMEDARTFVGRLIQAVKATASAPGRHLELLSALNEQIQAVRAAEGTQLLILEELRRFRLQSEWRSLGDDRVFRFQYEDWNINFHLPDGPTDHIERTILDTRTFYDISALEYIRGQVAIANAVVLDVGANIGNHTLYFAKVCGAAKVLAFEPMKKSYDALLRNIALNGLSATAFPLALSDAAGRAHSVINPTNSGGSGVSVSHGTIDVVTLDSLDIGAFSVLKIDVEGMACEVIRGARQAIARNKPQIIVEAFDFQFAEIDALLVEQGYARVGGIDADHVYRPVGAR